MVLDLQEQSKNEFRFETIQKIWKANYFKNALQLILGYSGKNKKQSKSPVLMKEIAIRIKLKLDLQQKNLDAVNPKVEVQG